MHGLNERASPDPEGRTRFVGFRVLRDPDGPVLEKNKGPVALRTPNGLIWAHETNEFFYIARVPSVDNYVTTWSRSMLKEIGENYDTLEEELWQTSLHPPRVIRPWPVLKLPHDHAAQTDPPIGAIDEGCDYEHSLYMLYTLRDDGYVDDLPKLSTKKIPGRCPSDPSQPCTGRLVENDAPSDNSPHFDGLPHDFLWCEHFREKLEGKSPNDIFDLVAKAICDMSEDNVVADRVGVRIYKRGPAPDLGSAASATSAPPGSAPTSQPEKGAGEEDKVVSTQEPDKAAPSVVAEKSPPPAADLFSTKDLPTLGEKLPEAFLPDILLVHDPERTTRHTSTPHEPIKYRRVVYRVPQSSDVESDNTQGSQSLTDYVLPPRDPDAEDRIAHLHLRQTNRLGTGHHSSVYRAPLTLPPPLSAYSPTGQVTVAAKLAFPHCTAHALLHNEARTYHAFPEHAQQEYCGYNIVPPCHYPVPIGPIVPRFYGFYLPVDKDGNFTDEFALHGKEHSRCTEDGACRVPWISPILLIEECGEPIKPEGFTADERTECFSLMMRLHELRITQGSFYERNVLVQPGPLSAPPSMRTLDKPSFRIIDFGRARVLAYLLAAVQETDVEKRKAERSRIVNDMYGRMRVEEQQARDQFLLGMFEY
ncbi:hypothetical protein GY45DRAFT_1324614 [Cubamyces sp. BRFM 1775]|nr:hypothetical protein GY45DRAFT_1324614 [Cubamyces sp. BRFM 1775]